MGNPRKPTKLLLLNGGIKHNPKRYADRLLEPKPNGPIGAPPEGMTYEAKQAWCEIVAECPTGVLTSADRGAVEHMSILRAYCREGVMDVKAMALLLRYYTELGMTPASRSKVQVKPVEEKPNAFAAV